jgi:acyl dehydratase
MVEYQKFYDKWREATWTYESPFPVEYDPIIRYCAAIEDQNPYFLDPVFASKHKFEKVLCPPSFVWHFARPQVWPKSDFGIYRLQRDRLAWLGMASLHISDDMTWHAPVRVGDQLRAEYWISKIEKRPIPRDPQAVWLDHDRKIFNQRGELVNVSKSGFVYLRSPKEVGGAAALAQKPRARRPESVAPKPAHVLGPSSSWEDANQPGVALPDLEFKLTEKKFYEHVSAVQDWMPPHHSTEFATAWNYPAITLSAHYKRGLFCRLLTDVALPDGELHTFRADFREFDCLNDTIVVGGAVDRAYLKDGVGMVDLNMWIKNNNRGVSTRARATISLPRKSS